MRKTSFEKVDVGGELRTDFGCVLQPKIDIRQLPVKYGLIQQGPGEDCLSIPLNESFGFQSR